MRPETERRQRRGLPPVVTMSQRRGWRVRMAWWMRCLADRIDHEGAFRSMSPYSYTFERGRGIVLREDGHGNPLWYWGPHRERAWDEADTDWRPPVDQVGDLLTAMADAIERAFTQRPQGGGK